MSFASTRSHTPHNTNMANLDANAQSLNSNSNTLSGNYYSNASYDSGITIPTASQVPFRMDRFNTSYLDSDTVKLFVAGNNQYGQMGNGTSANVQTFTALTMNNSVSTPFINPIDWEIENASAVIDSNGQLWMAGYQSNGGLGNGVTTGNQTQFKTDNILGLPDNYKATSVRVGAATIVILDNGDIYGAGSYQNLGLSATGGTSGKYSSFTKLDLGFDASEVVDYKLGASISLFLLKDGSLVRVNSNGVTTVANDVTSFDLIRDTSYYSTSNGDVYYASATTAEYTPIVTGVANLDSVYTAAGYTSTDGWAYLTSTGDVYYSSTRGGTDLVKVAENVIYFDMGGNSGGATLGAMTSDDSFKLWGSDNYGQLGNGDDGNNNVDMDNPLDAFLSDAATPSTPNSDGTTVSPDPELAPNFNNNIPSFPPA